MTALLAGAGPAAADPPRPTDYRSTVTAITPAADGVRAEVVGGDAFLELRVDEGHEVVVAGYEGEPYLRFRADGTVERNARSEATYLNDDRQGDVDLPAGADNEAEPEWETVADGGTYAWHDHRIHWMGGSRPPGAEPGDVVQSWTVPLSVDGAATEVSGELVLVARVSPLPWIALGIAGAAAVVVLGRRRPLVPAVAVTVAAAGALVVGWAEFSVAPTGSGANPLLVAVPLVGLVAAGLGVAFRGRGGWAHGDARRCRSRRRVGGAAGERAVDAGAADRPPGRRGPGGDRAGRRRGRRRGGGDRVVGRPAVRRPAPATDDSNTDGEDPVAAGDEPAPDADDAAATRGGGEPR